MKLMLYHSHPASEVLDELKSSEKGLHQIYAEARLKEQGGNHLRLSRRSFLHILSEPFQNALMLILLVALGISSVTANITEIILIVTIIILNASLGYWQSLSHERTLRTLETEATGHARVRRDGIEARIDAVELVPGDIVVLNPGSRVPADGRIIHSLHLKVNQLQLTGENEAISKNSQTLHSDTALAERHNMVYRGTYVASGSAHFVVTATGNHTEYGRLLQRAARVSRRSSLQQKITRLTHLIVVGLLIVTACLLVLGIIHGMPTSETAAYASAIIVAAVPAILTFAIAFVSTYVLRVLRRRHVLVRNTQTIEPISLISAIVSDKTGMLTRDTINVIDTWLASGVSPKQFTEYCQQATVHDIHMQGAPDKALLKYIPQNHGAQLRPLRTFGFEHATHMSGNLWHRGAAYRLAVKGAPEKILHLTDLSDNEREQAHLQLQKLTAHGHQILAVAWTELAQPLSRINQLTRRHNVHFAGFIAFEQRLRPEAKHAVAAAAQAGISVRMITGDHVETAYNIARQLDIATNRQQILDTRKLAVMSDAELNRVVRNVTVFARATPEQKHRLLSALRRQHVVAATGDSTDDIPALVHAHIGVSTAQSSLLARDASDAILLDNKFATLLEAIKWGRTAIGNTRRMFLFVITANTAEMAVIAVSLALGLAPALLPSQLLWINLVVSLALVVPLGLEPHSRHIMERRPVSPRARVLPTYLVVRMCVLACTMVVASLLATFYYSAQYDSVYAQTIVFTMFIVMQIASALSARSDHTSTLVRFRTSSPLVYIGVLAVLLLQLLALCTPLGGWLGLVAVQSTDAIVSSLLAAAALLGVSELLKWHSRRAVRQVGRSYM